MTVISVVIKVNGIQNLDNVIKKVEEIKKNHPNTRFCIEVKA